MAQWSWPGSRETGSSTAVGPRVQPNMSKTPKRRMRAGGCIEGGAPYSPRDTGCESLWRKQSLWPRKSWLMHAHYLIRVLFNAMSVPFLQRRLDFTVCVVAITILQWRGKTIRHMDSTEDRRNWSKGSITTDGEFVTFIV